MEIHLHNPIVVLHPRESNVHFTNAFRLLSMNLLAQELCNLVKTNYINSLCFNFNESSRVWQNLPDLRHAMTFPSRVDKPSVQFSSVIQSCPTLRPHESQHARPPCPSPTPGVHSNSRSSSRWCHPALLLLLQSPIPPSVRVYPVSQLFAWGGQSTGVSALASFLPKNTRDWSPLEWTGWISLQSKGLSRVFSNTTVQKHQFFSAQLSSQSNSHIHTWPLEKA